MAVHDGVSAAPAGQGSMDCAGLAKLDRAGWAWEWLRRNSAYRRSAANCAKPQRVGTTIVRGTPENTAVASPWGLRFRRRSGSMRAGCPYRLATRIRPVGIDRGRRAGREWQHRLLRASATSAVGVDPDYRGSAKSFHQRRLPPRPPRCRCRILTRRTRQAEIRTRRLRGRGGKAAHVAAVARVRPSRPVPARARPARSAR